MQCIRGSSERSFDVIHLTSKRKCWWQLVSENIIMSGMRTPYFRRKLSLLEFGCKVARQTGNWQRYAGDWLMFLNYYNLPIAIRKLIVATSIKWRNHKTEISAHSFDAKIIWIGLLKTCCLLITKSRGIQNACADQTLPKLWIQSSSSLWWSGYWGIRMSEIEIYPCCCTRQVSHASEHQTFWHSTKTGLTWFGYDPFGWSWIKICKKKFDTRIQHAEWVLLPSKSSKQICTCLCTYW